jgi:hypothetical protein
MVTWPAVVSAIASAIAATMALLTTMRAVVLERERSRDRASETKADYFKSLLTKPLSRETDKLTRLIQVRAKELVHALGKTPGAPEREALVQATIDEIREGFISLHHELRVATGAWQDDEIKQRLFRETQDWEDQTQLTIAALLAPAKSIDDARKACTAYRTALRRILFDADPLLQRAREREEKSTNALVRYFKGV